MDLKYSVHDWDLSAFYPEDDNLSDSDGILYPVGQEQQVSSVEGWLHTATEIKRWTRNCAAPLRSLSHIIDNQHASPWSFWGHFGEEMQTCFTEMFYYLRQRPNLRTEKQQSHGSVAI